MLTERGFASHRESIVRMIWVEHVRSPASQAHCHLIPGVRGSAESVQMPCSWLAHDPVSPGLVSHTLLSGVMLAASRERQTQGW